MWRGRIGWIGAGVAVTALAWAGLFAQRATDAPSGEVVERPRARERAEGIAAAREIRSKGVSRAAEGSASSAGLRVEPAEPPTDSVEVSGRGDRLVEAYREERAREQALLVPEDRDVWDDGSGRAYGIAGSEVPAFADADSAASESADGDPLAASLAREAGLLSDQELGHLVDLAVRNGAESPEAAEQKVLEDYAILWNLAAKQLGPGATGKQIKDRGNMGKTFTPLDDPEFRDRKLEEVRQEFGGVVAGLKEASIEPVPAPPYRLRDWRPEEPRPRISNMETSGTNSRMR